MKSYVILIRLYMRVKSVSIIAVQRLLINSLNVLKCSCLVTIFFPKCLLLRYASKDIWQLSSFMIFADHYCLFENKLIYSIYLMLLLYSMSWKYTYGVLVSLSVCYFHFYLWVSLLLWLSARTDRHFVFFCILPV